MEETLRSLARLSNYAAGLQQLMTDLQQAAPERSRGADRSGAVHAVLGADGLPEAIRVEADWQERLDARSFAVAVTEACNAAMHNRGLAWSRALERSGWRQRAGRLEADSAGAPPATRGVVPPAFQRAGSARRRSADLLAEEVIDLARDVTNMAAGSRRQTPSGTGTNRSRTLTVTLSPGGRVSCQADPRWAAEQPGGQLTEALAAALAAARQDLAASSSSGAVADRRNDVIGRQERLVAEAFAMLKDPRRSF